LNDTRGRSVAAVVPVFRTSDTLQELYERLTAALSGCADDYEIVFVEDHGGDDCWARIREMATKDPRVRGVHLARNYGQHNALLCGIRMATKDLVVTLDDDLQNPPEEIPRLLDALEAQGLDVVYGYPDVESHGFWRDAASQLTKRVLSLSMGWENARRVSAYRLLRTHLRDAFVDYRSSFISIDVLLTWGTSAFGAIPVRQDERRYGRSTYTFFKLVRHALNMVTGFSTLPLQLASWIGFLFTVFGACVLAYVLINYLIVGGAVPGFAFLASAIALFSGAQLFALGIMGEYLARMHFRLMDRPAYVVREQVGRG